MPKMGREGPAPERLRVDVWTNRKRDPELVEWLWRNPRVAGKKIRELLRAYLAEEGAGAPLAKTATATAPAVAPAAPVGAVSPTPERRPPHGAVPTGAPLPPASIEPAPVPKLDIRDQPQSRPDGAAARPAPAKHLDVAPVEAPKAPPRPLQQPRETTPPSEARAQPPPPVAHQRAPSPAPARETMPASAPPSDPQAPPPNPRPKEPPVSDQTSKMTQVHMTPEAVRAKEELMRLVRSAPKPGR
jgi:hypothetical protein